MAERTRFCKDLIDCAIGVSRLQSFEFLADLSPEGHSIEIAKFEESVLLLRNVKPACLPVVLFDP